MLEIGLLSTLKGPYKIPGEDGVRGAKLALQEHGYKAGGQEIDLKVEATNALASSAHDACRKLIDENVKLIVGPLSGDEAVAVRDLAKNHPGHTFVNGAAGSQPMFNPTDNFFMFNATGAQVLSGLGKYCFEQRGYRRVATIGEAYSFPFAQIGGFALDYVESGGEISKFIWCALGTQDYTQHIADIPDDVDAVFSSLGGTDGIHFLQQFREQRGDIPLIAGSIFADQSLLGAVSEHATLLNGVVSASCHADDIDTESWKNFVEQYRKSYPDDGFYSPSYFSLMYYVNMKATLLALDKVSGDVSKVQEALRTLKFEAPVGTIKLDHHRVAIVDTFVNEIRQTENGELYTHTLQRVEKTNCTFGMPDDKYLEIGNFGAHRMPGMQTNEKLSFEDIIKQARERGKKKNQ